MLVRTRPTGQAPTVTGYHYLQVDYVNTGIFFFFKKDSAKLYTRFQALSSVFMQGIIGRVIISDNLNRSFSVPKLHFVN